MADPTADLVLERPVLANDAEVSLLGAAMSGYPDLDDLLEAVEPDDFYTAIHGDIWRAIGSVHRAGNQPDPVSVRIALGTVNGFNPIRLFDMMQLCPIVAQAGYYAEQVVNAAGLRRLQSASVRIYQIASSSGELAEQREMARQAVDEACAGREVSRARLLADVLPDVIEVAENGQGEMLSTGWPDVDRLIGGVAPGRLVVVGARPGVGKSLMGTNLALHIASRHRHAALIVSLEMPEREVGQRLLAAHASVNLTRLQSGGTEEREWKQIQDRYTQMADLPITIDDLPSQTIASIRKAARDVQRRRDDLALIVVDYLQLVRPVDSRGNRAEEIGEISRGLKLLARETGACVFAMAQVNRESSKRADGRPTMSDLRESGSIEADADQVVLLHQPADEIPELEVNVDKNRHGPRGTARLHVAGHYAQLQSVAFDPTRGMS